MNHHVSMTDRDWRRWGAELRRHRVRAGLTQKALADTIHLARPTIGAFESANRTPKHDHAVALDEAVSAGGALILLWENLSEVRDIPEDWNTFEKVEAQAVDIRQFQSALIPGLLQTEDYAKAVLRSARIWDEGQVAGLATARAERLNNLGRCSLDFVLNEEALRRGHGDEEVLRAQLEHVRKLIDDYRIRLQVIPLSAWFHPNPGASFRVLTLRDGRLIGQEEYLSGVNVVSGQRVNKLVSLFGNLQGESLSLRASVELLDRVRKELSP